MARELSGRGYRVYTTGRRRESLAPLGAAGIHGRELDVDDDESITRALDAVRQEVGHLDLLVNNAGVSQVGALVDLTRGHVGRIAGLFTTPAEEFVVPRRSTRRS